MGYPALRILIALAAGLAGGALVTFWWPISSAPLFTAAAVVGKLWLDGLVMTIVPLVFGLLVNGVASSAGAASGGRIAARALGWFAVLLVGACALSALVMTAWLAVWPPPAGGGGLVASAAPPAVASAAEWFAGLVPSNPIKAAAETAMPQVVVFALLFGYAATRIAQPLQASLITFLEAVVQAMLVIVGWILWVAPIGVGALAFGVGARITGGGLGALAQYVVMVSGVCLLAGLLATIAALAVGRISVLRFARAALPAQVVAVSTQSSLASLTAMLKAAPALGVDGAQAGVVLPLAVSLFRAASAAANVAVAIYLAGLHGIAISPWVLIIGVLVGAAVSLAAVGLPAQVSFFATIGPVCLAMGVPLGALPILLAIETFPDIFRTLGNVTADLAVACIVGKAGLQTAGAASSTG